MDSGANEYDHLLKNANRTDGSGVVEQADRTDKRTVDLDIGAVPHAASSEVLTDKGDQTYDDESEDN